MFASIRNVNTMQREFGDREILQCPNFAWDLDSKQHKHYFRVTLKALLIF